MNRPRNYHAKVKGRTRRSGLVGGLLAAALVLIAAGTAYCVSPYFATRSVASRLLDKTLPAAISEEEVQAISGNLRAALEQAASDTQSEPPATVLGQIGRAVVQEVRGQLLDEASRKLATREGIGVALYGWQAVASRKVAVERKYLDFPARFSIAMVDQMDGTPLAELVYVRSGVVDWQLVAVRPHWMRNQWEEVLRQIVRAGIQKVVPPGAPPSTP